ncbi:microtubule-associated tumor suppressor candidate 2 [Rhincodon typus]|uniref:microtubule-associated tumor suppressor candidate 2 n=1 Tax=Rhincodon typus TaxID=259920 RepID=UPI00202DF1F7|nr:microtubule-associated tumor suppressor candidate 2 [Rhincodon typus]
MQLSYEDSSSSSSLEKATKKDGSVETSASREGAVGCLPDDISMTDCCTGSLSFQEFYMDVDSSTHDSQKESEDVFKAISPSDLTSVETTGFHNNSIISENRKSAPELQTNVARPLNLVNVSPSHRENIISTTASDNEQLVAINKPETQTNLKVLSDQRRAIDAQNQFAIINQQHPGGFLPEATVQSRRNISEVKEGIDPCDVSQQSLTMLPEETAKIESSKEQCLKSPNVEEDQPLVQQLECYTGDSPVPGNKSSVAVRQGYKTKTVSPLQTEFCGVQNFVEAAEHLGNSFSNATSNVAGVKSTVSTAPSTTHKADNDIESDILPCTGTNNLSTQEFVSLHEAFEIIDGRKKDTRQSFVSGSGSAEHKAVQVESISSVTEKDDSETLSIAQLELSKHSTQLGVNTGMGHLPRQGVSLGQNDDQCSVKKTDNFSQKKTNEINSNVIIIGEKRVRRISEELPPSESQVVSQTVNPAIMTCTEVQQTVNMKAANQSSDSGVKEISLLNAGTLSESSLPPPISDMQIINSFSKASDKAVCNSGIPKPILQHPRAVLTDKEEVETNYQPMPEGKTEAKPTPKPKYVRPKIITYIRKPLQVKPLDAIHDALGLSPKLSTWTESISKPCISKEHKTSVCENKPLSVLSVPGSAHDRYRPELQRTRIYTTGLMVSGIKPPTQQTFPRMMGKPFPSSSDIASKKASETFTQDSTSEIDTPSLGQISSGQNVASVPEECFSPAPHTAVSRLPKTLRPPLGLGAISRLPAAKSRLALQSQRTSLNSSALQIQGQVGQDIAVDQKKNTIPIVQRSSLPKYPGHSGLRAPGYSRLPAAKLVAFGFVRSSSVSSVSSNQSNDSAHSDHSKTANRSNSGSEEKVNLKTGFPVSDVSKRTGKVGRQPSSSSTTTCWSLLPTSKSTPASTGKKEVHKDHDVPKPVTSSPKRHVTPASKLHPAGIGKLRGAAGVTRNGFSTKTDLQSRETERQTVQRLKDKCKKQAKQLQSLHDQLQRASLSIEVLAVTTQHFHHKNESALIKEKELSIELAHIREEVALNTTRCEKLQKEKEELERRFENELQRLHLQQQKEILDLEERLKAHHAAEKERLIEEHREHLKKIQSQHKEQMEDLAAAHNSAITEMENNQTVTITILQDEHEKKIEELKAIHELERSALEEEFEKLRLSLQDQVDTLTFQNHSLKDKAKRFEEALRRSTNEQVEIALAPYQHLEEDMNSLKHVLEMKNQQIHHQEKKIIGLEKLAEKNVVLEEKVQILQQQNEDLKARIDNNVALTRQLSEENATLHEYVEKESKEMKRLSRTNEELVWRLQTGEPVSPVKMSSSSSNFQSSQGTLFPSAVSANPR